MQSSRRALCVRAVGVVGALVFVAAGWSRISFNVEILKLLPAGLRQVRGLSLLLKEFVADNELIITVEARTAVAA